MQTHIVRILPCLVALGALAVVGCAKDPAKEATSAQVAEAPAPAAAADEGEAAPKPAALETLAFTNETSKIGWVGSKVTRSHEGGFREFAGEITLDASNLEASKVEVTIQTASLHADVDDLANHLKTEDFFDVERFPTAKFESTRIVEGAEGEATHTVTGNLTLHGVTKQVTFPATIGVDAEAATAQAEFSIDRNDWGLTYPGMPDDLIRDGVVLKLDLRALRNDEV